MASSRELPLLAAPAAEGASDPHMVLNLGPQHRQPTGFCGWCLRLTARSSSASILRSVTAHGIEKTCEAKVLSTMVPSPRVEYLDPSRTISAIACCKVSLGLSASKGHMDAVLLSDSVG